MRLNEFNQQELEEGWKSAVAGAGLGFAAGMGALHLDKLDSLVKPTKPAVAVAPQIPIRAIEQARHLLAHPYAAMLKTAAERAGIHGTELAQFLAQCAHESHNFNALKEYGGSLDFRKYDPKYNPVGAKKLGNVRPGDGAKFAGKGFIQLTGRENYRRASQALGVDLVRHPELATRPEVAAKIAVWFWQERVQPAVTDFNNVEAVTKPINSRLMGLEDRKIKYIGFKHVIVDAPKSPSR